MLQHHTADDFVLATGETYSVRTFVEYAFAYVGLPITWQGSGIDEKGMHGNKVLIRIDPKYFRPTEVDLLLGDSTKAKTQLNWKTTIGFSQLVSEMVQSDLALFSSQSAPSVELI